MLDVVSRLDLISRGAGTARKPSHLPFGASPAAQCSLAFASPSIAFNPYSRFDPHVKSMPNDCHFLSLTKPRRYYEMVRCSPRGTPDAVRLTKEPDELS